MAHGFSGGGDGRWPSMSRAGIGCVLGVLALAVATAWAADASTLRYGFKAGQKYIYEVRIEGNSPDEIETVTGQSTYTVKSVDTSGQMTLANSANLTTVNKLKEARVAPMAPRRFGPPGLFHGPNYNSATDLTINPQGKVIKHVGENQLPYMLGNLFELLIDPLPAGDQMQWQVERDIALTKHLENFRFGPPFMRDREASRSATETRS